MVLWAGNHHDGLPATDHHLARALAATHDVVWVDPPRSVVKGGRLRAPRMSTVEPGLAVLDIPTPPGPWRPGLRAIADLWIRMGVRTVLATDSRRPAVHLVCSPRAELPPEVPGRQVRVLHVTDDWLAGASMMGVDVAWVRGRLEYNLAHADVVTAVSVDLARTLSDLCGRDDVVVVPNGATAPSTLPRVPSDQRLREAVLVGQLNERLDFELLQAVVDAGVDLRIMGPRTERDPEVGSQLDRLLADPRVNWMGPVAHEEVSGHLARARVGLTPYLDNDFNRSSFPLKTLEYLAIGLPTVSTPLESLDWLGTDLVDVAATPAEFAAAVVRRVDEPLDPGADEARRRFAERHTWTARAGEIVRLAELARERRLS